MWLLWFQIHKFQTQFGDWYLNTLRLRWNGQHFADDIFKHIFFNETVWILIKIYLKFILKGLINCTPALVQIMTWRCPVDKPLSEPMLVSLPTHIWVTRPQWVTYLSKHYPGMINRQRTSSMVSEQLFRLWLGAVRQQAITWANVDPGLCCHMASLDH